MSKEKSPTEIIADLEDERAQLGIKYKKFNNQNADIDAKREKGTTITLAAMEQRERRLEVFAREGQAIEQKLEAARAVVQRERDAENLVASIGEEHALANVALQHGEATYKAANGITLSKRYTKVFKDKLVIYGKLQGEERKVGDRLYKALDDLQGLYVKRAEEEHAKGNPNNAKEYRMKAAEQEVKMAEHRVFEAERAIPVNEIFPIDMYESNRSKVAKSKGKKEI